MVVDVRYLVNGTQMKAIDSFSIEQMKIPSLVLMEKAAMAVTDCVMKRVKHGDKILAVCGVGNNGGDGIAAARILKEAGLDVSVLFVGEEAEASEQTKRQLEIGHHLDLPIFNGGDAIGKELFNIVNFGEYNIILDAIFGIGLSKPVIGRQEEIMEQINNANTFVVAVDIPSGIHADSGAVMNCAVKADVTVTFGYEKLGLTFYPGTDYAGEVIIADIGFPKKALEMADVKTFTYDISDKRRLPERPAYSNKGTYGRVLIIGGAINMCGAAYFAAKSANLMGAGLVKIMTVEENRVILQSRIPEALLSTYKEESFSLEWFMQEILWATTIVIGPGLGMNEIAGKMISVILNQCKVPTVIDADALNYLSTQQGLEAIKDKENIIITPHLKEMTRLFPCSISDITKDMVCFGRETLKDSVFTLVLKDARTIVSNGLKLYVNQTGNAGMAVGGSGDVLAGIIGGLLAQGMEVFEAAALGVYLHGLAGDAAAEEKNMYSMTAGDIAEGLVKEIGR